MLRTTAGVLDAIRIGPRTVARTGGTALLAALTLAGLAPAAGATTQTFHHTTAEQTFTVPAGVSRLEVTAAGANGANVGSLETLNSLGGKGAQVSGQLAVTAGETLYVEVGAPDKGQATDVRTSPRADGLVPEDRLIVAGGGGEGGNGGEEVPGGRGGNAGKKGEEGLGGGGLPGTQTSGGKGGLGVSVGGEELNCDSGQAGTLGTGGQGGRCEWDGGRGGDGYYGGGGGGGGSGCCEGGGGGGGGSSLVPPGGREEEPPSEPFVQISFTPEGLVEMGRCTKLTTAAGEYKDSKCTKPSAAGKPGHYEWDSQPLPHAGFELAGTAAKIEGRGGANIECLETAGSGLYTGSATMSLSIQLRGCSASGAHTQLSGPCQSASAPGEIRTAPLTGNLDVIQPGKSSSAAGWGIAPTEGSTLASFTCGSEQVALTGGIIAPVSHLDKMSSSFSLHFRTKLRRQDPLHFEDELVYEPFLVWTTKEQAGMKTTMSLTGEEPVDLRLND
jgi:hypothetical protein